MKNWYGKRILISGVTSGLGYLFCQSILEKGAIVYGIHRGSRPKEFSNNFVSLNCDLKEINTLTQVLEDSLEDIELDGIFLAAGIEDTTPFRQLGNDKVLNIFSVNLFANMEILKVALKKRNSKNNIDVILISSIMSTKGASGKVAYSSSKAALDGLVRSLALELAPRRIRVNAIAPGMTDTRMGKILFESLSELNKKKLLESHPLGFSEPQSIVQFAIDLMNNSELNITGQIINIDGGYSIR